jgi:predicted ArsR family transcriptional regulator
MTATTIPKARATDPVTSHDAADEAQQIAAHHRAMVLQALKRHGAQTAAEIADVTPLDSVQATRRLSDLLSDGLVTDTGQRRPGPSGRLMRVLAIAGKQGAEG